MAHTTEQPSLTIMHSLTLTFVDDNHVKQEWQSYADGKPSKTTVFTLTRKG